LSDAQPQLRHRRRQNWARLVEASEWRTGTSRSKGRAGLVRDESSRIGYYPLLSWCFIDSRFDSFKKTLKLLTCYSRYELFNTLRNTFILMSWFNINCTLSFYLWTKHRSARWIKGLVILTFKMALIKGYFDSSFLLGQIQSCWIHSMILSDSLVGHRSTCGH
jgi:hypothetical protein